MLATRINLRAICTNLKFLSRNLSSKVEQAPSAPQLARTKDGSTIIAWHKAPEFPYECTKPLPESVSCASDTVLKTQMSPELLNIFNKKSPELARLELMNITHTTKHRWFPKARSKKAKKTPMDRQYL